MKNRFLPAVAVLAVAGGLLAVAYSNGGGHTPTSESAGAAPHRVEMPAVSLPKADGTGDFSSTALRGKSPLVLNFFATW